MIRLILVGVWACIAMLGADFAMARLQSAPARHAASAASANVIQGFKTKEINVPRIVNGRIAGYVVAQFVYYVDTKKAKSAAMPADPFVVAEAYRYLYEDGAINFADMKPVKLSQMTDAIRSGVNKRIGAAVVTDVVVQELTFLSSEQAEKPI
jgi:hypothetical protein